MFTLTYAEEKILRADFRHRPPEMVIKKGKKRSGPLKDIIEEAVQKLGYKIKWRNAPFPRSLGDLKGGKIDILPRTVRTQEREKFINYLGPIGYQQKNILFLVKKGQESLINRYEDLKGLKIAVKRRAAYFKRFDEDTTLNKRENLDDDNKFEFYVGTILKPVNGSTFKVCYDTYVNTIDNKKIFIEKNSHIIMGEDSAFDIVPC